MSESWEALPYGSTMKIMLTPNLPNFFRWKILQIKLMLHDLQDLAKKHEIPNAIALYKIVQDEANYLCMAIGVEICHKRTWRKALVE